MIASLLLAALPAADLLEQEARGRATAYRVDEIHTLAGEPLKNATVVVREGVIEQMGIAVVIPDHAEVVDLRGTGATISPPLVLGGARFLTAGSRGGQNSRFTAAQSLRPATSLPARTAITGSKRSASWSIRSS